MIIDRFTKFSLSILVFSLCLNALNPWLSPTLANAEIEDIEVKNEMKIIAQGINRIADIYEKQQQLLEKQEIRALRQEQRELIRYERQEQRAHREEQRDIIRYERLEQRELKEEPLNLMQKMKSLRESSP